MLEEQVARVRRYRAGLRKNRALTESDRRGEYFLPSIRRSKNETLRSAGNYPNIKNIPRR